MAAVVRGSPEFLRQAVAQVSEEEGWVVGWLNDGLKGFVSGNEQMETLEEFSAAPEQGGGLRIFTPSPQYLFAMKCMAMRADGIDGSHDISDVDALADIAEIEDAEDALQLVEAFYPSDRMPATVRFGLEEIMERVMRRRAEDEALRSTTPK